MASAASSYHSVEVGDAVLPEEGEGHTESYFRRTSILIFLIFVNTSLIVLFSVSLGMLITLYPSDWLLGSYPLFLALTRLGFEIQALYTKDDLERGSWMLCWYCFSGCVTIWKGVGLVPDHITNPFLTTVAWISFGVTVASCLLGFLYILVLVKCGTGLPQHNREIRIGCRSCCRA